MNEDGGLEPVRIAPAGDAALRVEFPERIDPRINARVIATADGLRRRLGSAIRDVVVGYSTLTVYFDPLKVDPGWLETEMQQISSDMDDTSVDGDAGIEVPVCYGGEFGPDLADVAAYGRCAEQEVIERHSQTTYRVYMVGFVPGFAYMASVDAQIAAPRRPTPRAAVPAGSVAIAGRQTGIYPSVTPGGWNIIGRTPLLPYDLTRRDPFLFHAGDTVQFRPISVDVFRQMV